MVVKAPNGQELKDFERLARVFFRAESTNDDNVPTLATAITPEVGVYEKKLKQAMSEDLQGYPKALDTFKEAQRMRSALMTSPAIKGNEVLHEYVKNTMIIGERGDPAASLAATKDMYAKSLDPDYKGESVNEDVVDPVAASKAKPIL